VITPHDIERYMNAYGAQQGIDDMHEDFHRWIRQLRARGLGDGRWRLAARARAT
jgi:hypothetical protein